MKKHLLTLAACAAINCSMNASSAWQNARYAEATTPWQKPSAPQAKVPLTGGLSGQAASRLSPFAARKAEQAAEKAANAARAAKAAHDRAIQIGQQALSATQEAALERVTLAAEDAANAAHAAAIQVGQKAMSATQEAALEKVTIAAEEAAKAAQAKAMSFGQQAIGATAEAALERATLAAQDASQAARAAEVAAKAAENAPKEGWFSWLFGTKKAVYAPDEQELLKQSYDYLGTGETVPTAPSWWQTAKGYLPSMPTRESLTARWESAKSNLPSMPTRESLTTRWEGAKGYLPSMPTREGITTQLQEWQAGVAETAESVKKLYEEQGFAAVCKNAGGKFTTSVQENPKPYVAAGVGIGLALGAYAWYRWYNQLEKQIVRAARAGRAAETEKYLNQLVANVNASAGTAEFAKKQVAALNIFRDASHMTVPETPEFTGPEGVLQKIDTIGKPYYVAWTLAEFEPVYTKLFTQSKKTDADFKRFVTEAAVTSGRFPHDHAIRDIVIAAILNATDTDNAQIRADNSNNPTRAEALIKTKYLRARDALKAINNAQTKAMLTKLLTDLEETQFAPFANK